MWKSPKRRGIFSLQLCRCGLLCLYFQTRVSKSHEPRKLPVAATFVWYRMKKNSKKKKKKIETEREIRSAYTHTSPVQRTPHLFSEKTFKIHNLNGIHAMGKGYARACVCRLLYNYTVDTRHMYEFVLDFYFLLLQRQPWQAKISLYFLEFIFRYKYATS